MGPGSGNAREACVFPPAQDVVLMRALRDMNLPKFVFEDVPLFLGLISDLFPGLDCPRVRYPDFNDAVEQVLEETGFIVLPVQVKRHPERELPSRELPSLPLLRPVRQYVCFFFFLFFFKHIVVKSMYRETGRLYRVELRGSMALSASPPLCRRHHIRLQNIFISLNRNSPPVTASCPFLLPQPLAAMALRSGRECDSSGRLMRVRSFSVCPLVTGLFLSAQRPLGSSMV